MTQFDAIIIGAGAAGLMCAATAGQRSKRVLLLDHSKKIGEKIRISGGGRCNFTNIYTSAAQFLSSNPHFCKSALKQYTQHDFIALVEQHGIAYHEKTLGQLFCNESAQQIIDMLLQECADGDVDLRKETSVESVVTITARIKFNQRWIVHRAEARHCQWRPLYPQNRRQQFRL